MPILADHDEWPAGDGAVEQAAARRVGVLVLGMHRSGTSAITRMLSLLGCGLPQTLMAANPSNPEGHWESDPIAQLNDDIFALAGTQWDDWVSVNPRLSETLVWPQLIARGREVLRQEFADAPLFVLKDPRICKLTSFWLEVFAAENVDAAVVVPLRHPIEVTRSLKLRDGSQEYQGLLSWLRHVLAAEAATRGRPRVFTEYALLLNNWEKLAARVAEGLDLVWPRVSKFSGFEISQFLTPDLRHYVSETAELDNNPAISPWVRDAYAVLLGWAQHEEKAADYPVLDRISREFDDAAATFARPLLEAGIAVRNAARADADRAAITAEHSVLAQRLGEVEGQFAQASAEREARTAERDEIAPQLSEVQAQLAQLHGEREAQAAEQDRLAGECTVLTQENGKLVWRLGEVEADLAGARDNSNQAQARISGLTDDLAAAQAGAESLDHRLAVTTSTLHQREEEIAQLGGELEAASRTIARHADAATAAREDADLLAQECRSLRDAAALSSGAHAAESNRIAQELAQAQAARQLAEDQFSSAMLAESLDKVAMLKERDHEHQQHSDRQQAQVDWLRRVHAAVEAAPRWWAIMPEKWRRERETRRLQRKGLFDADAYLSRYPDVQQEGMAPLRHYILHGMVEGRSI